MWIATIISFVRNKGLLKPLAVFLGIAGIVVSSLLFWGSVKENLIEEGRNQVIQEYRIELIEEAKKSKIETEKQLLSLRENLRKSYEEELARKESEVVIDKQVEEVIKYVEKEVFITPECDYVDDDLTLMFNKSISRINKSE